MSKSLVPQKDKASRVTNAVKTDLGTAGIVIATAVGYTMIPVFGWAVGIAGTGYLLYRSVKRGLKNDE